MKITRVGNTVPQIQRKYNNSQQYTTMPQNVAQPQNLSFGMAQLSDIQRAQITKMVNEKMQNDFLNSIAKGSYDNQLGIPDGTRRKLDAFSDSQIGEFCKEKNTDFIKTKLY